MQCFNGATEDAGPENAGPSKMYGWKTQDWKTQDHHMGVENARPAVMEHRSSKKTMHLLHNEERPSTSNVGYTLTYTMSQKNCQLIFCSLSVKI